MIATTVTQQGQAHWSSDQRNLYGVVVAWTR